MDSSYGPLKVWLFFRGRELEDGFWYLKETNRTKFLCDMFDIPYSKDHLTINYGRSDGLRSIDFDLVKHELIQIYGYDVELIDNAILRWTKEARGDEKVYLLINNY